MNPFANMTPAMIDAHNARVAQRRSEYAKGNPFSEPGKAIPAAETAKQGDDRESKVRVEILAYCDRQWPKWVPMYARTDVPSTLNVGAQDVTIFGPFPLCILVDTKSKNGKPSPAQRIWECRLNALKWEVHWVKTMTQFESILRDKNLI